MATASRCLVWVGQLPPEAFQAELCSGLKVHTWDFGLELEASTCLSLKRMLFGCCLHREKFIYFPNAVCFFNKMCGKILK